jgi:hypothetical protein
VVFQVADESDVVIAIERPGPSKDGKHYTMRGVEMDPILAPLERLFTERRAGVRTVGIGDGGNEVGMGKVLDRVYASAIPNAQQIACVVPADHLIVAGVSNWGGYALAAALALVAALEGRFGGDRLAAVNACVVTETQEMELIDRIVDAGARDGITGEVSPAGRILQSALVDGRGGYW